MGIDIPKKINVIWISKQTQRGSYGAVTDRYEIGNSKDKLKNVHKLENVGHSDLVLFMWLGPLQMQLCIKYEGSMTNHFGRRGRYRKKEKWLPFKNVCCIDFIFHVHVLGVYVHVYAIYEVSMVKPVAKSTINKQRQCPKRQHMMDNS